MKSIKVIIEGLETQSIEKLDEQTAQFLVGNFLTTGYPHKVSETVIHIYPVHRISRIEVEDSVLLTL